MARYRKVDPRVWDDERFIEWDDLKRSLWLLLLTGPAVQVVPGIQVGGVAALAETLRRPVETVRERFGELLSDGRVEVDERFRIIRLTRASAYNEPDNPNQVKGWYSAWDSLPESPLKYAHLESLFEACELADSHYKVPRKAAKSASPTPFTDAFLERFGERLPKRFRNRSGTVRKPSGNRSETVGGTVGVSRAPEEQEQEQEQEHDLKKPPQVPQGTCAGSKQNPEAVERVFVHWQTTLMPRGKRTVKRLARIKARFAEGFTEEELIAAISGALKDPWLMGEKEGSRDGGYRDILSVLRDAGQVERLSGLAGKPSRQLSIESKNPAHQPFPEPKKPPATREQLLAGLSEGEKLLKMLNPDPPRANGKKPPASDPESHHTAPLGQNGTPPAETTESSL